MYFFVGEMNALKNESYCGTRDAPHVVSRRITQDDYDELLDYYYEDINDAPMYPQFVRDLDIEVVATGNVFIGAEEYYKLAVNHGYPTLVELGVSGRYQYWNYYVTLHEQYGVPQFERERNLQVVTS